MLLEIRQRVNVRSEKPIEGIKLAVREGHLQKKLKDAEGIWLCGNFPDAELKGGMDCHQESNVLIQSPNLQHFNIFGKIPEPLNQPYAKFTNFR